MKLGRFLISFKIALLIYLIPTELAPLYAASPNIVISQVYGGGGNAGATLKNDFIELYNRGSSAVDVTGWSVQYAASTGTTWQRTNLSGIIQPGTYYLIQQAAGTGGTVDLPTPNAVGTIAMSATAGKVALVNNAATLSGACPTGLVDLLGYGTATNCFEGAPTGNLSNTTAALRNANGGTDTDNNSADFTIGAPNPRNALPPDEAPLVASTTPANGAPGVALNANLTVTFSEPVNLTASWFTLSCSISGNHTATVSGGPAAFTLDPTSDFANGDNCTLTILANQVSDQDNDDPPDNMAANFTVNFSTGNACAAPFTPIYAIQGNGPAAAVTGAVTTQGVVIGDYEGPAPTLRGFYIQDSTGDGDPTTSDGIFVFNGNNNLVALGDVVRVTGTSGEFQEQTQISSVTAIVNCGMGSVTPVDVTFPVPSVDYLERFEGMLVRLPQTMSVTEHFQLGRFGQVVLSEGGRLLQPTNVVAPGAPALALQAENNLSRIILDDSTQDQNPDPIVFARSGAPLSASNTLRGGDTATGIVGVLTYTWAGNAASGNAYRIRPFNALGGQVNFVPANPRPSTVPAVGGTIKVVGMNLLNFFNTFANCTSGAGGPVTDCRGADNQAEFDRQWPKTLAAILAINGDIIGVNEMENDGYGANSAIAFLVDQLNAATAPGTYAFIDADGRTGQPNALGTDAIKVGLIYKAGAVTPVGQTAALNSTAFVNGGDSGPRNRPALAQAFEQNSNNQRFIVAVNHLKSKGSACDQPDQGDGQGNCNAVRVNAANQLTAWLATNPTGVGDPDILLIGDFNAYAMEDPITAIESAGYTNLVKRYIGPDAYSFVFDGQWGYLDHAFGSQSALAQITGVAEYHINADEPSVLDYNTNFKTPNMQNMLYAPDQFRVSDHDPIIVGLCTPPSLTVTASPNVLWPPNNKLVTVNTSFMATSDTASVALVSVTSNERNRRWDDDDDDRHENGRKHQEDIVIVDNDTFKLRAERSGRRGERIYTIKYQTTNTCGATSTSSTTVTVPRRR